jgi:hypothetical protein
MEATFMKNFGMALIASLAFAGCMDQEGGDTNDTDSPDTETASTEQGVNGTALSWHGCTQLDCGWNIGNPATQTCFVSGITGKLASGTGEYPAGVMVVNNGTYWGLWVSNPSYENIGVMTTCITNTANRVSTEWMAGTPSTLISGGNASRKCFLAGVYNYNGKGFSTWESDATIKRDPDGLDYWIGGSFPSGSTVKIGATCVDIAENYGDWGEWWGYSTTLNGTLAFNPASNGVACGLTGIGGLFTTADQSKGVVINYNTSTRYWYWTMTPGVHGYAECFR